MADPTSPNNQQPPAAPPSTSADPGPSGGSTSTSTQSAPASNDTSAASQNDSFVKAPGAGGGDEGKGDATKAASPPARPEWLPETLWDAEKGAKADDIKALIDEASAARDAKSKLPATADAYQPILPKIEGLPEGVTVDANDPRYKAAAQLAHKAGLSQEAFSELLGVEAQRVMAQNKALGEAIAARDAALGPNGAARVDALTTFFQTIAPNEKVAFELGKTLFTPGVIESWERVQRALGAQGVDSLKRSTGASGEAGKIPGYAKMSMAQKLAAAGHI